MHSIIAYPGISVLNWAFAIAVFASASCVTKSQHSQCEIYRSLKDWSHLSVEK